MYLNFSTCIAAADKAVIEKVSGDIWKSGNFTVGSFAFDCVLQCTAITYRTNDTMEEGEGLMQFLFLCLKRNFEFQTTVYPSLLCVLTPFPPDKQRYVHSLEQ